MIILRKALIHIFIGVFACIFINSSQAAPTLVWTQMRELPPGVKIAIVQGDPAVAAQPFVLRLKLPASYIMPAHRHATIESETLISGQYYAGEGNVADGRKGISLNPGETVTIPANVKHYGFTVQPSVIEIRGTGPWKMDYE